MKLSFTIPGQPVAKQRARGAALKRCRRCQKKTTARICRCGNDNLEFMTLLESTPKETVLYENKVALYADKARVEAGQGILEGPISLAIKAYFQIPKSRTKLNEGDRHCQRPDLDNILKSIKDGMNKVVYRDDCLIYQVFAAKFWGEPRVEVELEAGD